MSNGWHERDQALREQANAGAIRLAEHKHAMIRCIKRLIELDRCASSAVGWFTQEKDNRLCCIGLSKVADGRTERGHQAITLKGLPKIEDGALLTIRAVLSNGGRIVKYTAGLSGILKNGGSPWFARIDFDCEPYGQGPCCHPLLHCHIGTNPDLEFQPRVPLPWLMPVEALEWLLATADAAMEPPCP